MRQLESIFGMWTVFLVSGEGERASAWGLRQRFRWSPRLLLSSFVGSVAVGLCQLLQCGGSPLASAILSACPPFSALFAAQFRGGRHFLVSYLHALYPGSGWGRQLWPARYPGLGDCWGLVGVG